MITILGTILPPLIILTVISLAYSAFIENQIVKLILRGMQAGVAAVVIDVSLTMILGVLKGKKIIPIMVMVGAFVATFLLDINVVYIILASGLIGAISIIKFNKKSGEKS